MPTTQPFSQEDFTFSDDGGIPDGDDDRQFPEQQIELPWTLNPEFSWLFYDCWVEVHLDAGMALHKALPQRADPVDTLASVAIDQGDMDAKISGVNFSSASTGKDVIQRMATSTYRFVLKGRGMRAGYQIPIPGIVKVGGVPAIPERVQTAYDKIIGNLSGIPMWYAQWELHYIVNYSPGNVGSEDAPVPFNPALKIRPDAELPEGVQLPQTQTDARAVQGNPVDKIEGFPAIRRP
jgi:hypothetical protein